MRSLQLSVKWLVDRVGAALGLVLLSPLLAAIAVWVLLETGRPVVLVQQRAKRGGTPFGLLKFRTMVRDAIDVGRQMGLADPYGLLPNDPRITRSGRFLRRTSLDELPQLVNVLKGEMSLVGPRPDLVEQVANYSQRDRRRLEVRPGITGWSQVRGRDEIGWPERIEQDIWYVDHWSLGLDLKIVWLTIAQLRRPEPAPVEDSMNIERAQRGGEGMREVGGDEWDELVQGRDVYFRRAYVEASALLEQGARPLLLHRPGRGGGAVLPLLVRDDPRDATSAYGYGGPLGLGGEVGQDFWAAYDEWAREVGVVSTFVRFHPLLGNAAAGGTMRVQALGPTVGWRLDGAPELAAAMDGHHRRLVRRAEREGLTAQVTAAPGSLDGFARLYEETMRRNEAAAFYFFSAPYWQALSRLGDALVQVEVRREDVTMAGVLCFATPPWLHYHLGGSSDEGRRLGASHLALLAAAQWAQAHGYTRFHLGGGVGGREDSLFEFKRRFCPEGLLTASVGKAVHDVEAYRRLAGVEEVSYDGFFPAYRAAAS
jgi:lipopolysaccharide/colanic/teichoic acid biosynthesis glycosyltransferase